MTPSHPRQGFKRLLISALALNGLLASPAIAELDDTTISVAVAQGNAHCLIETKTMAVDEALAMAKAFIASDGISDKARDAVTSKPEFSDLMSAYIADQGGLCRIGEAAAAVTHPAVLGRVSPRFATCPA